MPGRSYSATNKYRYGFNGKEGDGEVNGEGNSIDYGERIYDPRIGRWLSLDPLQKKYPDLSAYSFCGNSPIVFKDFDGRDFGVIIDHANKTIIIVGTYYTGSKKSYEQAQKAIAVWNNKTAEVDGYTVSFKLQVDFPCTDNISARKEAAADPIGNFYQGGALENDPARKKGIVYEGGQTHEGKYVTMNNHTTKGDLGERTNDVGHEFGHTFGLQDAPAPDDPTIKNDYYSPGGIMQYKTGEEELDPPSTDDVKNIVKYAKDILNSPTKQKENANRAKVKLLEVKGSAKKNPLGKAASNLNPKKGT